MVNLLAPAGSARLAVAMALGLFLLLPPRSPAHADDLLERVRAHCGDDTPAESLCNVETDLREAYLVAERHAGEVDLNGSGRVRELVRSGQAGVEWYPESLPIRPRLYAFYYSTAHTVYVARSMTAEPTRVQASILAHELTHAVWSIDNLGADMPRRQACIENEKRADAVGVTVYERLTRETSEPEPHGEVDRLLADDVAMWHQSSRDGELSAAGLETVTRNHVFAHGYADGCSWQSE